MTLPDTNYEVTVDWTDTWNAWRDVFAPLAQYTSGHRLPGVNLVTSEHLATYQFGSVRVVAELTTGIFPVLGARPRESHRVFGCSVGFPDAPSGVTNYGQMIEATTMPDVLARWWDAAMTGLAYWAYPDDLDPVAAEHKCRDRYTGGVLDDVLRALPAALEARHEDRQYGTPKEGPT